MRRWMAALLLAALLWLPAAGIGEYDAPAMEAWLDRFCEALSSLEMLGDPALTADPARPREVLLEYAFGTVTATSMQGPLAGEITGIDVRTDQVTDCRGMRVGMTLEQVLQGQRIGGSSTQLYVLGTQEAGLGFAWAYIGESGVYGVEYVTYGGEGAVTREYTLTYVIDGEQRVSAIRVRCADVTQTQAEQAVQTAEEIARRQQGEVYAMANGESALEEDDLRVMGMRALGQPAGGLVSALGEPVEIQTLAGSRGRLLLYEGATVGLGFKVQTGEELIAGVSASGTDVTGPRGLRVGMSVQEAASLFRCDADVYAVGGVLYIEGEAAGEPPYGEIVPGALATEATLRYLAALESGATAVLEVGVSDGIVTYWHFFDDSEAQDAGL